ncbi:MAG: hypothetical protein QOI26_1654, partial [Pseudonocardiales bacterium]|nr:hypothetical protein [Pseudonocardiales bacterium]
MPPQQTGQAKVIEIAPCLRWMETALLA